MMQAGKLRHRVVIQRQQETQSQNDGSVSVVWQDVATVWGSIEALSAREFVASQEESSRITTRITIRYRSDITAKMRLYHAAKDKYYNIEGILSDKDSGLEYLSIPCSEGVRYQEGDPAAILPVILEYPAISGNPSIGETLSASSGLWANDPASYEYQWYLNGAPIFGEVVSSWIVSGLSGDLITVGVKAINSAGETAEELSDGVLIS